MHPFRDDPGLSPPPPPPSSSSFLLLPCWPGALGVSLGVSAASQRLVADGGTGSSRERPRGGEGGGDASSADRGGQGRRRGGRRRARGTRTAAVDGVGTTLTGRGDGEDLFEDRDSVRGSWGRRWRFVVGWLEALGSFVVVVVVVVCGPFVVVVIVLVVLCTLSYTFLRACNIVVIACCLLSVF